MQQFHGQPDLAVVFAARQHRDDVRVRETARGVHFAKEASTCFLEIAAAEILVQGQYLQRDMALMDVVECQVNHRGRAAADLTQQAVGGRTVRDERFRPTALARPRGRRQVASLRVQGLGSMHAKP